MRASTPFLLAAGLWASPALAPIAPPVARALRLPRRLSDPDAVALTFDDGPHPVATPAVLEVLRDAGATATFFLVGEQVERYPALAAEIVAAGHSLGVHGFRHRNQLRLTRAQISDDLDRATATIADAYGRAVEAYRPPYGIFSPLGLHLVRERGLRPLLWSRWGHDWRRGRTAGAIADEITVGLRGGDILLLHDADHYSARGSWRNTVEALPTVLSRVEAAGLRADRL
jgi:peptidoglycan-N-acetylglucosamine deacetylase